MLLGPDKRLPTLEEYAACLLPNAELSDDLTVNQFGLHSHPTAILPVKNRKGFFRLTPGPEFGPRLYRGQNKRYSPCRPSLYRVTGIDRAFWITKTMELGEALFQHPACLELMQWTIAGLAFDFNLEAIAQHYGYPTTYMDFSRSRDVAMFFATCAYNAGDGSYTPLKSGSAVLYTADLQALLQNDHGHARTLPLGLEPMPRPEAQRAFAIAFGPDEDLEGMHWVSSENFDICPSLSATYYEMFDGGRALFPPDPFDLLIDRMRRTSTFSVGSLERAIEFGFLPPHRRGTQGAIDDLASAGYQTAAVDVVPASVREAARYAWSARQQRINEHVRVRPVSDHYQGGQQAP